MQGGDAPAADLDLSLERQKAKLAAIDVASHGEHRSNGLKLIEDGLVPDVPPVDDCLHSFEDFKKLVV